MVGHMHGALRSHLDQIVIAWRADQMARRVLRSLRSDDELRALGVRFLAPGEDLTFKDAEGLEAFWISPGGNIDSTMIRERLLVAPKDFLGFHIEEFRDKLAAAPKAQFRKIQTIAERQLVQALKTRAEAVRKVAPGAALEDVKIAVWLDSAVVRAWIDDENIDYAHVMMRLQVAMIAVPDAARVA